MLFFGRLELVRCLLISRLLASYFFIVQDLYIKFIFLFVVFFRVERGKRVSS